MARKKQQNYIKGTFKHRRTERDYMGVLLDAVTLEDWGEVVKSTVAAAKGGDQSARTFLAQYLVGKPDMKALSPVTVVVQQLSGVDPLVDKLANRHIHDIEFPVADWKSHAKARLAAELQGLEAQKANMAETRETVDGTSVPAESRCSEQAG
jgi:hypothetical protein